MNLPLTARVSLSGAQRLRLLGDRRPSDLVEPIEEPPGEQFPACALRLLDRRELDLDEDLVRVLDAPADAVAESLLTGAIGVCLEVPLPGLVIADLDPGEHVRHASSFPAYSLHRPYTRYSAKVAE